MFLIAKNVFLKNLHSKRYVVILICPMKNLFFILLLLLSTQAFLLKKTRESLTAIPQNNYPIRAGYIDQMTSWYGMDVAKGLGLPGYAAPHDYNYLIYAFWSC